MSGGQAGRQAVRQAVRSQCEEISYLFFLMKGIRTNRLLGEGGSLPNAFQIICTTCCLKTDRQTDRQTDIQTDRQTDKQTGSISYSTPILVVENKGGTLIIKSSPDIERSGMLFASQEKLVCIGKTIGILCAYI